MKSVYSSPRSGSIISSSNHEAIYSRKGTEEESIASTDEKLACPGRVFMIALAGLEIFFRDALSRKTHPLGNVLADRDRC